MADEPRLPKRLLDNGFRPAKQKKTKTKTEIEIETDVKSSTDATLTVNRTEDLI